MYHHTYRTFTKARGLFWLPFTGFITDAEFQKELTKLKDTLDGAGLAYNGGSYYRSQLSSPWDRTKVAEVWVEAA